MGVGRSAVTRVYAVVRLSVAETNNNNRNEEGVPTSAAISVLYLNNERNPYPPNPPL